MSAYNKFYQFVQDLADGVHNLSSNALMVALSNSAPVVTNTVFANISEISAGNGYTAGGNAPTITSCVQTTGVLKLVLASTVFTAAGGSIGPLRYAVLYNATPTSPLKPLIAWFDYGSSITLATGETLTIAFDPTAGVLTIQ